MITRRRNWLGRALMAALAGLVLFAAMAPAAAQIALTGAGATFPFPLYSKWFQDYERETGVKINYQAIGSGGGIQQLTANTVDFAASDALLTDAEVRTMGGRVLHIPTVSGAVAMVYNVPGVPTGMRLTPDVIGDIYLGNIRMWNDTRIAAHNPGRTLPRTPIAVVRRSDSSGTTDIFTHYLTAVHRPWGARVGAGKAVNWPVGLGGKGNDGVAGLVRQMPGAIGYVELAYARQTGLTFAHVRNSAGNFIEPNVASTTAAAAGVAERMKTDVRVALVNAPGPNAYPIAGWTYILVFQQQQDAAKARQLKHFLNWAITEGQKSAPGLLYAPLPPEVVEINRGIVGSIR